MQEPTDHIILSEARHTARKRHECAYCYESIMPGERYIKTACIEDDGSFVVHKCHAVRCPDRQLLTFATRGYPI